MVCLPVCLHGCLHDGCCCLLLVVLLLLAVVVVLTRALLYRRLGNYRAAERDCAVAMVGLLPTRPPSQVISE